MEYAIAVSSWWNCVKDNQCWSGAIVGLSWDDLWPEAKDSLNDIYYHRSYHNYYGD